MPPENLSAAAIGSFASAMRYRKQGFVTFLQVFFTGIAFSYYATQDILNALHIHLGIVASVGVMYFLTAYYASEVLAKISAFIKAFKVANLWKR